MNTLPPRQLLRIEEVAAYYAVSRQAVYRWIEQGKIDVTQTPGGTIRILRASVLRLDGRRNGDGKPLPIG